MMVHSSPLEKAKTLTRQLLGSDDKNTSLQSNDSSNNVSVCYQEGALTADKLKSSGSEKPRCQQRRLSDEGITSRRGRWSSPSSPVVWRRDHSSSPRSNPRAQSSSGVNPSGAPPYSPDKVISPSFKRRTFATLPSQAGHQQRENMSCPTTPSTPRQYFFPSTSNSLHQHKRLQHSEQPFVSDDQKNRVQSENVFPKSEGKVIMVKETCQSSGDLFNLQKPPRAEYRHRRIRSTDSQPSTEQISHQSIVKEPISRQNNGKHGRDDGRPHGPIFPVWKERPNLNLERIQLPIKENPQMTQDRTHVSKSVKHHPVDHPQRNTQVATREEQVNTNQSKENRVNKHANILPQNLPASLKCLFKKAKPVNMSTPSTPEMKRRVMPTTRDNQRMPPGTPAGLPNARLTCSRSMVDLTSAQPGNVAVSPPAPASGSSSPTDARGQVVDANPGSRGMSEVEQMNMAIRLSLQVRNDPLSPRNQVATRSASTTQDISSVPDSTKLASFASEPTDGGLCECIVCMSRPANAVIYTCGHLCMCCSCALGVKASQSPKCPMCRAHIKDVIRVYTS
uniref:Uncharacterized protein LOC116941235 n=1 Tax=Petromyzon marinus TaxID=7757 RepID=A0AAJ7SYR6_PETMA|nr:uncharacterized protein LOC116941235 [Petromyzon marinus]